jgi:hypothetical protein
MRVFPVTMFLMIVVSMLVFPVLVFFMTMMLVLMLPVSMPLLTMVRMVVVQCRFITVLTVIAIAERLTLHCLLNALCQHIH